MARDHTRVNIDIWGDDEFRELPVDAQALYWLLWTSPDRTYCGVHEWRPGKLTQRAGDWTVGRLNHAAAVLSERLFLIVDTVTEECLLRSWIKHDGLWRIPNMAVTMSVARASVGSRTLRGVIVHEVQKLVAGQPDLSSWKRDEVKKLLAQNPIDPATLEPFNPGPNGGVNHADNPIYYPAINPPIKGYGQVGVNPPVNPAPTTATATSYLATATKEGGYVSTEGHQGPTPEPPPCQRHPTGTERPCSACGARREWERARAAAAKADELDARRRARELADNCPDCHGTNLTEVADDEVRKCDHPYAEQAAHA